MLFLKVLTLFREIFVQKTVHNAPGIGFRANQTLII